MRRLLYALSLAAAVATAAVVVSAQGPPPGSRAWVHIPDSTIERLGDIGVRAHTNHLIRVSAKPQSTTPTGQSPQALWNYYVGSTGQLDAGSKVIAIVDAYHYPTAANDLAVFSNTFSLPTANFQVVYASGKQPRTNCGWAQEAALDIEWAHAMAPKAKIILVEAASASFADLFKAVDVATNLVGVAGGGQVSMSWGGSEFSGESSYDTHFVGDKSIVYFASSGDTGGKTIYPSVSPNVVAAGGTSLVISNGTITGETGWSGSGGGPSKYETVVPSYQLLVSMPASLTTRGVPDISYDADPYTGVSVYDSTSCQGYVGWMVFGGTSVSAPSLAGLNNAASAASTFELNTTNMLLDAYGSVGKTPTYTVFRDVISGTAGTYTAGPGWDFVTGLGTPKGLGGM